MFKGFIDLVVKTPDGKYHIIDWKTCSWGWDAQRALSWAQEAEGSEAFQTPYVTGAPETVIERIRHVVDAAELDGLMLILPDYLEDLAAFGTHVLPALRAAESGAGS